VGRTKRSSLIEKTRYKRAETGKSRGSISGVKGSGKPPTKNGRGPHVARGRGIPPLRRSKRHQGRLCNTVPRLRSYTVAVHNTRAVARERPYSTDISNGWCKSERVSYLSLDAGRDPTNHQTNKERLRSTGSAHVCTRHSGLNQTEKGRDISGEMGNH